ncbi:MULTISPECIES: FecCD family ABC transporter permease [Actinomadura]|uniref:FecCD family ABC transporter permease n=1 Tax=Actinomadura yumaensis TaxID=111807 RepID=A0ABW2CX39_9ACTN|nr:iron chelate uptake ABC transporter family permease subunit [Actinomadura sp. J1-007]MWK40587.1 iron chelate uptake ABC transporter family permease subunit [Actinomadura sp. J1-007]
MVMVRPRGLAPRARPAGLVLGVLLLAAVMAASLVVGARRIPLDEVWHGLFAAAGSENDAIVRDLRLPRTLIGAVAGAALGLAGAVMQTLTRNPLADPGLLGVNAGASAAVVTAIGVFGVTGFSGYLWFAFAGAGAAAFVVNLLGGSRAATPVRLALAGTAVNAALFGYVNGLQLTDTGTLDSMRHWSVGALDGRRGGLLAEALPFVLAGALLALALARSLDALALGDDSARSLGARVTRVRALSVVAITLLAGGATAVCGPIGFIGLMVPHAVRLFCGTDSRWLFPYSLVYAPTLLLASDIAGRVLTPPAEIEVGIVTAFAGGLLFIYLVRRGKAVHL